MAGQHSNFPRCRLSLRHRDLQILLPVRRLRKVDRIVACTNLFRPVEQAGNWRAINQQAGERNDDHGQRPHAVLNQNFHAPPTHPCV